MAHVSDRRRVALEGLAVVATAAALWVALGPFGLAVAGVVAVTLALSSAVYAFGAGQLLYAIVATTLAGSVPLEDLLVAQLGLGALLLATLAGRWPLRTATVTAVAFAVAAAGFATAHTLDTLWHGAAIVAVVYAVLAYTLHRYELVRLDLVTEADR